MARIARIEVAELMDITDCARYLGVSNDSLYKYANTGRIPAFKLGNRWRFKKSLIDVWIQKECEDNEKKYPDPSETGH